MGTDIHHCHYSQPPISRSASGSLPFLWYLVSEGFDLFLVHGLDHWCPDNSWSQGIDCNATLGILLPSGLDQSNHCSLTSAVRAHSWITLHHYLNNETTTIARNTWSTILPPFQRWMLWGGSCHSFLPSSASENTLWRGNCPAHSLHTQREGHVYQSMLITPIKGHFTLK